MKKLLATLLLVLFAGPAWAASILEDAGTGQTNTSATVSTTNVTVTGSNTYLACFLSQARSSQTVTSVTWDAAGANEALALITDTGNTNFNRANGRWYGLASPTAGTNKTVTTIWSSGGIGAVTHCLSFSGVDQAAPASGGVTSNTDGSSASISVTSAVGDLVVAGLVVNLEDAPGTINAGTDETIQTGPSTTTQPTADENITTITLTEAGAASVTINPSWTTSTDLVLSGFSLKAAAASTQRPIAPIIFQ